MAEKKKHPGGRPPKFKDPQELQSKINDYFESCWIDKVVEVTDKDGNVTSTNSRYQDRPYTVEGLALALGITRETLCQYEKDPKFSDAIKKAKLKIKMNVVERLIDSKNATGCIFWLKNNDREYYNDKIETHSEVNHGLSPDVKEMIQKVLERKE